MRLNTIDLATLRPQNRNPILQGRNSRKKLFNFEITRNAPNSGSAHAIPGQINKISTPSSANISSDQALTGSRTITCTSPVEVAQSCGLPHKHGKKSLCNLSVIVKMSTETIQLAVKICSSLSFVGVLLMFIVIDC